MENENKYQFIKLINDELIEIREYAKPNACFQTNEYPDSYDFCILKEQFNPFDLYYKNEEKDKEIERLNNKIKDIRKELEILCEINDIDVIKAQLINMKYRIKGE